MTIKEWPASERPREKLLKEGAESLSDAELLAIFLRTGIRGKSAVELSRDLLNEYGDLRTLLEAPYKQFISGKGLGEAKYSQLHATLEIGRRYLQTSLLREDVFNNPDQVKSYLQNRLRHLQRESFLVLFLDNQHRLIRDEILFQGTVDQASVHVREVIKRALELESVAMIIAHNHPSGVSEPSQADIDITKRIDRACRLLDLRLLDHMVIGESVISLAERGLL